MRTSEAIDQIAVALSLAQSQFKIANKSGTNPFFKNSKNPDGSPYSTLEDILMACKEALGAHHLVVIQSPKIIESRLSMTTRILHKSGQWIEDDLSLKPKEDTPQGIGTTITYARRYQLGALLTIGSGEIDDDGNIASGKDTNEDKEKIKKLEKENADLIKLNKQLIQEIEKLKILEQSRPKKIFKKTNEVDKTWVEDRCREKGISNEDTLVIIEMLEGKDLVTELQPVLKKFQEKSNE